MNEQWAQMFQQIQQNQMTLQTLYDHIVELKPALKMTLDHYGSHQFSDEMHELKEIRIKLKPWFQIMLQTNQQPQQSQTMLDSVQLMKQVIKYDSSVFTICSMWLKMLWHPEMKLSQLELKCSNDMQQLMMNLILWSGQTFTSVSSSSSSGQFLQKRKQELIQKWLIATQHESLISIYDLNHLWNHPAFQWLYKNVFETGSQNNRFGRTNVYGLVEKCRQVLDQNQNQNQTWPLTTKITTSGLLIMLHMMLLYQFVDRPSGW
jgi:hypothetical protein